MTATAVGMAALEHTASRPENAKMIETLIPVAVRLAEVAHLVGDDGITVSELRHAAVNDGILTGRETGRELSYLGAVMSRAGLVRTGSYRRSSVPQSHGNLQAVWEHGPYRPD